MQGAWVQFLVGGTKISYAIGLSQKKKKKKTQNWIKDLNIRPETNKLLEENTGRILFDINFNKILFEPPPEVMEINKWDLTKLKSSGTARETTNKMKNSK